MSTTKNSELETQAITARLNSYSPYSQKQVGAALKLSNGKIYRGCNVENSSFGGTVCAERVAIWNAVCAEGTNKQGQTITIDEIAVATDATPPWSPCGLCRQVMNEFASPTCKVYLINLNGERVVHEFKDLLPFGFDRSALF